MDEPSKLEGHHDLSVIDFRSKAVPAKAKKTINSFLIPPLPPNKSLPKMESLLEQL